MRDLQADARARERARRYSEDPADPFSRVESHPWCVESCGNRATFTANGLAYCNACDPDPHVNVSFG